MDIQTVMFFHVRRESIPNLGRAALAKAWKKIRGAELCAAALHEQNDPGLLVDNLPWVFTNKWSTQKKDISWLPDDAKVMLLIESNMTIFDIIQLLESSLFEW